MAYIEFKSVCKNYDNYESEIKALKKIDFEIEKGQLVVITGSSLAGKTTCLNILSLVDKLTSGDVIIDDVKINELTERKIVKLRRNDIGFVLKQYGLLQNLTVLENIELAYLTHKEKKDTMTIIRKLSLTKKKDDFIDLLNDEEKTKALIARAVIKKPKLLLCDDVFDNLNKKSQKQVLKLFQNMSKKDKTTIVMVTSNQEFYSIANKVITLKNGSIIDVKTNKKPKAAGDLSW